MVDYITASESSWRETPPRPKTSQYIVERRLNFLEEFSYWFRQSLLARDSVAVVYNITAAESSRPASPELQRGERETPTGPKVEPAGLEGFTNFH